ncbi:MAG: SDR family oxidoreductase [Deltaproteobacteria bacterium]|nr:SDR family oxidoreductase [Deltaproteobacteria bacterium]
MKRKTAVITGAGSGIGRAAALHFAQKKYRVVALGRTLSKVAETAALARSDEEIFPIAVDVTQPAQLTQAIQSVKQVNALVINAGICEQSATNDADADLVWRRVIDTNLTGSWNTVHAVSERLHQGAKVVFVSSGLGKLGRAEYTAYAASKHGMLGMMKCLALEWAPRKINVNAVCPGWVDTDMALSDLQKSAQRHRSSIDAEELLATAAIPIGRFVSAAEVASLIGWLCSAEATAITGQACNISGGEFGL